MQIRWMAYSKNKQDLVFVHAESQREAIVKAMDRGIKPARSSDVRPDNDDAELMGNGEFEEFMN
jgi:hypothetical protein